MNKLFIAFLFIISILYFVDSINARGSFRKHIDSFKRGFNEGFSKGSPAHPATNVVPRGAAINRVIAVGRGLTEGVGKVLQENYPRTPAKN
jgi:hypothetical protein